MKSKSFFYYSLFAIAIIAIAGCAKDGADGNDGADGTDGLDGINGAPGTANVKYSEWLSPAAWLGASGDYYFDVTEAAITQNIIDLGVVLAYVKLTSDGTTVRPLPANTGTTIWNYIIPAVGTIEFTTTFSGSPSLSNSFRYVIIPGGSALKAAKLSVDDLLKMPYSDVCKMLGIPE